MNLPEDKTTLITIKFSDSQKIAKLKELINLKIITTIKIYFTFNEWFLIKVKINIYSKMPIIEEDDYILFEPNIEAMKDILKELQDERFVSITIILKTDEWKFNLPPGLDLKRTFLQLQEDKEDEEERPTKKNKTTENIDRSLMKVIDLRISNKFFHPYLIIYNFKNLNDFTKVYLNDNYTHSIRVYSASYMETINNYFNYGYPRSLKGILFDKLYNYFHKQLLRSHYQQRIKIISLCNIMAYAYMLEKHGPFLGHMDSIDTSNALISLKNSLNIKMIPEKYMSNIKSIPQVLDNIKIDTLTTELTHYSLLYYLIASYDVHFSEDIRKKYLKLILILICSRMTIYYNHMNDSICTLPIKIQSTTHFYFVCFEFMRIIYRFHIITMVDPLHCINYTTEKDTSIELSSKSIQLNPFEYFMNGSNHPSQFKYRLMNIIRNCNLQDFE